MILLVQYTSYISPILLLYLILQVVSDKISEYTMAQDSKTVLDLGCGDGLVGEALSCRGFSRITGLDIAEKMLEVAAGRGVYQELKQADLMKTLPVESATFDIVSCVGTSTYLSPTVMGEWLRVVKEGGVVAFTHKTAVLEEWEKEQDKLEQEGRWKNVFRSDPLCYLPGLVHPALERVTVFIYRKL